MYFNVCNKGGPFFSWTLSFLHLTPIPGSYSSDFAYWLYLALQWKSLKLSFLKRNSKDFFKILNLSSPNAWQKYLW